MKSIKIKSSANLFYAKKKKMNFELHNKYVNGDRWFCITRLKYILKEKVSQHYKIRYNKVH